MKAKGWMTTLLVTALAAAGGGAGAQSDMAKGETKGDRAAPAKSDKPVVVTNTVTAKAQVVDVDKKNRIVTLKREDGTLADVQVGDRVKNFDKIKKGDQVVATYYESVGLDLRKAGAGGPPSVTQGPSTVQLGQRGGKPSGVAATTQTITATIESIDRRNRMVTLRGPSGKAQTVHVGDEVRNFDMMKNGDQVEATYTQAMAVSVEKPAA
jgi:arginine repressor